jgi:hypothetical protein
MAKNIDIEVVLPEYQVILSEKVTVLPTLTDVSQFVVKGGSSVNYPTLANRDGQRVTGAGTSFAAGTDANYADDSFDLNQKCGDVFAVNVHLEEQNKFNALQDSTRSTLEAIGKQADRFMIGLLVAGADGTNNLTPTASLVDDIVDMAKILDDNKVPEEDRFVALTNADMATMRKEVKDFIRYNTDKDGLIGEIYGIKVVRSNFSELTHSIMYHKKAGAYAWQSAPKMLEGATIGSSSISYEISRMLGGKCTQAGAMVVIRKEAA